MVIRMLFDDTVKHYKPHVHVQYAEYAASVGIDGEILAGELPAKQMKVLQAWLVMREEELYKAWTLAVRKEPIQTIEPLG
jgi:hypothetical protein